MYGIKVPYPPLPLSNNITPRAAHFTALADYASPSDGVSLYGALLEVLGNRGAKVSIPGEHGNKDLHIRGTSEQRQFWETGNIGNEDFDFGGTREQSDLHVFQGNKGTGTPGRVSCMPW